MNEEVLKDDPLKKPKKILVGIVIVLLSLLMIGAFSSFFYLYADYFSFKENEANAQKALAEVRARCQAEIAELNEKKATMEMECATRVKQAEARAADAEKASTDRVAALDEEYRTKKEVLDGNLKREEDAGREAYKAKVEELNASYNQRKTELRDSLMDFQARYAAQTNNLEAVIRQKQDQVSSMEAMLAGYPEAMRKITEVSNELIRVVAKYEAKVVALTEKTSEFDALSHAVGVKQGEKGEIEAQIVFLQTEVQTLAQSTNKLVQTVVGLNADVNVSQGKALASKNELAKCAKDLETIRSDISNADQRRSAAEQAAIKAAAMLEAIKGNISVANADYVSRTNRLAEAKADARTYEDRIATLRQEEATLSGEVTRLKAESADLEGKVAAAKKSKESIEKQGAELQASVNDANVRLGTLKGQCAQEDARLVALKDEVAKLQSKLDELKGLKAIASENLAITSEGKESR